MGSISDRAYLEADTSEDEREAIRSCMKLVDAGIVRYHETPRQTEFSIRMLAEGVARETAGLDRYAFVVDLTRASTPDSTAREALRRYLFSDPRLVYVAVFTGRNTVLNVVARLVLGFSLRTVAFSVFATREEALARAQQAVEDAGGPCK